MTTETVTIDAKAHRDMAAKLAFFEAQSALAKAQLELSNLGISVPTMVVPSPIKAKKTRKPRKEKAPVEVPDNLEPLPECLETKIPKGSSDPLYKVFYKSGTGNVRMWGVVSDETVEFGETEKTIRRMLKLRPLVDDGSRLILQTTHNFNRTKGFDVPVEGAKSGGKVLGMVPGSLAADAAPF